MKIDLMHWFEEELEKHYEDKEIVKEKVVKPVILSEISLCEYLNDFNDDIVFSAIKITDLKKIINAIPNQEDKYICFDDFEIGTYAYIIGIEEVEKHTGNLNDLIKQATEDNVIDEITEKAKESYMQNIKEKVSKMKYDSVRSEFQDTRYHFPLKDMMSAIGWDDE